MSIWKNYIQPQSIEETLQTISQAGSSFSLIAGGTDLLLEIQQGRHAPVETLVDVTAIPELSELSLRDHYLRIGAGVPVSKITRSKIVLQHATAVAEATGLIGGPQVRNVATLGGNVGHALPAADGMIALVAMDAFALIVSPTGIHEIPILQLFRGPGITALQKNQVILAFKISENSAGEGSAFRRIMRPQGVALPILNLAIWIKRDDQTIASVRIAFGPSGPIPSRAMEVEKMLIGNKMEEKTIDSAIKAISTTVKFRSSKNRASAEYRYQLAGPLFFETLQAAWERSM